jgi:hydrogenase maturation protease
MQTECLLENAGEGGRVEVSVRFLHVTSREIGLLDEPISEWVDGCEPSFRIVPEPRVGNDLFQTWQEAVERTVRVPVVELQGETSKRSETSFRFAATRTMEPLREGPDRIVGVLCRCQEALTGVVETEVTALDEQIIKLTVRVRNQSPISRDELKQRTAVELRTFASAHTVLRASGARFISMMDPPEQFKHLSDGCRNVGTWPVLVGNEGAAEHNAMLSSPIILYDYPKLAPESAGPLFDGTEIDEILTLSILTMTEEVEPIGKEG